MSFNLAVGVGRRCTLYSRSEYRSRFSSGAPEEKAGRDLVGAASAGDLMLDTAQFARLREFLHECSVMCYDQSIGSQQLLLALQRAVRIGDVIAVVEQRRPLGGSSRGADEQPCPRSITFTPSQLFKRTVSSVTSFGTSTRVVRRLAGDDGIAIWLAKPGEVLPDGTIATALCSAQSFEYLPDMQAVDEVLHVAGSTGTPGNNQAQNRQFKAVVKMMGLNPHQARLLHEEISGEGLGYHEILGRAQDMFGGK